MVGTSFREGGMATSTGGGTSATGGGRAGAYQPEGNQFRTFLDNWMSGLKEQKTANAMADATAVHNATNAFRTPAAGGGGGSAFANAAGQTNLGKTMGLLGALGSSGI